ncbi:hypothetical protein EJ05DRAFT_472304 [Pseudovirgaria hyperparasitica]|uniref:Ubiquinol-cytochrome c chaperone domain-containing protein n=1 Tax=Pseudovirgaria hyperparasitica TaxID=470096 RepID=A0A6A6WMG4_9PEZI|nr:uncharacterized protein EJ05DRAFT_472304 [Pseudovirgaria hyperparasitica]KAF2763395.1 hypothetical protein EJ05DRAFT_472304 [Pseudovirgaria hyperparasitica]
MPTRHLSSTPLRLAEATKIANSVSHDVSSVLADFDSYKTRMSALQSDIHSLANLGMTDSQRAEYNTQLQYIQENMTMIGGAMPRKGNVAQRLRHLAPNVTETYAAYGATMNLVQSCTAQADYSMPNVEQGVEPEMLADGEEVGIGKESWWFDDAKLPATFATWAQVSFLHIYLLHTRLRLFPTSSAGTWQQHLIDHFFNMAEKRMITHHLISSSAKRQSFLKGLSSQWRGAILSYDEGLMRGDAVLAAAVWRNVFNANEDVNGKVLAMIVGWMRKELWRLDQLGDEDFGKGLWVFGGPAEMKGQVMLESKFMRDGPQLGRPI